MVSRPMRAAFRVRSRLPLTSAASARGSVALAVKDCCSTASFFSGRKAEDLLYKGSLRRHVPLGHGTHLSLGQHRHRLDPGQRPLRRPEALKAEHGPGQAKLTAVLTDQRARFETVADLPAAPATPRRRWWPGGNKESRSAASRAKRLVGCVTAGPGGNRPRL